MILHLNLNLNTLKIITKLLKFVQKDVILFPVDETVGSEYYFYKNNEELPYETVIEKDIRKIFKRKEV